MGPQFAMVIEPFSRFDIDSILTVERCRHYRVTKELFFAVEDGLAGLQEQNAKSLTSWRLGSSAGACGRPTVGFPTRWGSSSSMSGETDGSFSVI